jgi:uncharacterized membrane protein
MSTAPAPRSFFAVVRGSTSRLFGALGNRLLAGIAFAIPLVVTYWVLSFGYGLVTGLSEPWLKTAGINIPGLGFVITLLAFMALGFMATHVFGRRLLDGFEQLVLRIPIVASIYSGTRQVMQSLQGMGSQTKAKRVVAVEYLTPGSYMFGFATGRMTEAGTGRAMTTVFVPTAPNPTTGLIFLVPDNRVTDCDMTAEEATKMLVSGGIIMPTRPLRVGDPGPAKDDLGSR